MRPLKIIIIAAAIAFVVVELSQGNDPAPATNGTSDPIAQGLAAIDAAVRDPEKRKIIECLGVNPHQGNPADWRPPSEEECDKILASPRRQDQTVASQAPTAEQMNEAKSKIAEGHRSGPKPRPLVAICREMFAKIQRWDDGANRAYSKQGCWHKMEADNGKTFMINLGLIQDIGSGATAPIYSVEGSTFDVSNMKRWYFTCTGYFSIQNDRGGAGQNIYAPANSVAAQMSNLVCAGAKVARSQ